LRATLPDQIARPQFESAAIAVQVQESCRAPVNMPYLTASLARDGQFPCDGVLE
jgi:hypothetical protein